MEIKEKTGIGRREFIGTAAAALFAGVLIQVTGCSSDDSVSVQEGDVAGSVSDNHGHSAVITKASIDAGGTLTLDIKGSAGHTHTLTLTAEDMAKIKAKTHVMNSSSTSGGHAHSVMFN
jgi:hypothetical protein